MTETDRATTPNGPWLRRSRRIAYENPWITIWHDEVSRPDGSPGIYGLVHFVNLAVGVVVLDEDDRVLLVGQHRYALGEQSSEIPEGGVPARASMEARIMTELHVLRVFVGPDGGGGNPLGVFLDGSAVPADRRAGVATELGFSETVFVDDRALGAIRIFTPAAELPFAGHPTVGTAWLFRETRAPVHVLPPPAGGGGVRPDAERT